MEPEKYIQPEVVLNPKPETNYTLIIIVSIVLLAAIVLGYMWYAAQTSHRQLQVSVEQLPSPQTSNQFVLPAELQTNLPVPPTANQTTDNFAVVEAEQNLAFETLDTTDELVEFYRQEITSDGGVLHGVVETNEFIIISAQTVDQADYVLYIKDIGDKRLVNIAIGTGDNPTPISR